MSDRTTDGRPPRKGGPGNFSRGKPTGGKLSSGKPAGGKPFRGKPGEGKPFRDRTEGNRPITGRNSGDKPGGNRIFRGKGGKPAEGRPFGARPYNDENPRPQGDRPEGDRPEGERAPRPRHANPRPSRDSRPPAREGRWNQESPAAAPRRETRAASPAATQTAHTAQSHGAHGGGRIAKVIARAGACSRRDAEAWILDGRVSVNGTVLDSPALNVGPEDRITIDGQPLASRERTRLFMFNKPRGLVTTNSDPEGRTTIFEALPDNIPRLISVGRLDINTEGLMLLTNDGGLARVLELPATGWLRRYRVRAHGETDQAQLDALMAGVTVDGIDYRGIEAKIDREQGANLWMTIGLREGKNREVKRVLESLGLEVNRLIRVSYGPFQLGELGEGEVEEVTTRILRDQLGERLAEEAEADFDGPVFERRGEVTETYTVQSTGRRDAAKPVREEGFSRDARFAPEAKTARHEKQMFSGDKNYRDEDTLVRKPAGRGFQRDDHSAVQRAGPDAAGKRKHVSALRDISRDKDSRGSRMRVEKSATADRKGRPISVERRMAPAVPERDVLDRPDTRNARRFAEERGERPMRRTRPGGDSASARTDRAPRREWVERPPRGEARPARDESRQPRDSRPPRDGARPPRAEGRFDAKPRERSDRPGKSFEGKGNEGKTTYAARSSGPRSSAPRDDSRPKFGGKPGAKPFGGKPGARPSSGRPSSGRPSSGKSFGEKPAGGGGSRTPRKPRDS